MYHGIQPLKKEQGRREGAFGRERGLYSQSWISQSTAFKGTDVTASKTLNLSKHIHHTGKLCFPIWCDIRPRINQHALEKKKTKNQHIKIISTTCTISLDCQNTSPGWQMVTRFHIRKNVLSMDLNRAVGYVLLSPFFTRPLKQRSDNTVQKNQIYHTSPQPSTLMQNITIQQARVQLPPEWSFHACAAPLLVQVLPMTFRAKKMLPLPLPLHGHCTSTCGSTGNALGN